MILVVDQTGALYDAIRGLGLGYPVVRAAGRTVSDESASLLIAATAAEVPWDMLVKHGIDAMVVTSEPDDAQALDVLARGGVGYVDARSGADILRRTIHVCRDGGTAFSRRVVSRWLRQQRSCSRSHGNSAQLTKRQREVLGLVAQGLADKEIADRLGIATATAQKHLTNILERLDVPNRAAAVASVCELLIERPLAAAPCYPASRARAV